MQFIWTSYTDEQLDLNQPQTVDDEALYENSLHSEHLDLTSRTYPLAVFAYRVRATDKAGKLSGPSSAFFTIPSSPQQVFSREQDDTCQLLKWAANPEKGVVGYRVYRMDRRWNKDPVSRLTPDAIDATEFADETVGPATRRYYVVAVDALGQEGFPSSPVWYTREWQEFYKPLWAIGINECQLKVRSDWLLLGANVQHSGRTRGSFTAPPSTTRAPGAPPALCATWNRNF